MRNRDRILVVDDDGDACELIAMVLSQAGYAVQRAAEGFEALTMAASGRPDLVLTDLQMPGMNGIELISRLHAIDGGLPVVLITGVAETRDLCTAAESYGAVACLSKPVNLDELLWTIDCALACRRGEDDQQRPYTGVAASA
jgi:two-component system response regulator ResD